MQWIVSNELSVRQTWQFLSSIICSTFTSQIRRYQPAWDCSRRALSRIAAGMFKLVRGNVGRCFSRQIRTRNFRLISLMSHALFPCHTQPKCQATRWHVVLLKKTKFLFYTLSRCKIICNHIVSDIFASHVLTMCSANQRRHDSILQRNRQDFHLTHASVFMACYCESLQCAKSNYMLTSVQ